MIVTVDVETTGLDPRRDDLTWVGFMIDDDEPCFLRHPADGELVQAMLELPATFRAHGGWFDAHFLEAAGYRIPPPEKWEDTQILAHVAGMDERRKGGTKLAALTRRLIELGELPQDTLAPEKAIGQWRTAERRLARKEGRRLPEKGDAPDHLLFPYLAADLIETRAVARHYSPRVNGQERILALERACAPALFAAERRGVPVDTDDARELCDSTAARTAELLEQLRELAGPKFNPKSIPQKERAFAERGIDLSWAPRTEKRGWVQFTEPVLSQIDDDLARTLLAYDREKAMRDFAAGLFARTHNGRLYTSWRQLGAETARMSSGSPNLQNLPAHDLRTRFVIRAGPGKVLVGADQDSVELRILACYARGGALERAFADGVDLHQQTADACGVDRDIGKKLNYLTIYGGGVPRVSEMLGVKRDQAKAVLDRWYRTYPEVGRLKARLARTVHRRGYLLTIAGRRHWFPDGPNHMMLNRVVSGSAVDLFKVAIIRLHAQGVPMSLLIHDEIVSEVDQQDADRVARLLELELARGMRRPGVSVDNLAASSTVAERWSDFKEPGYVPLTQGYAP